MQRTWHVIGPDRLPEGVVEQVAAGSKKGSKAKNGPAEALGEAPMSKVPFCQTQINVDDAAVPVAAIGRSQHAWERASIFNYPVAGAARIFRSAQIIG